MKIAFVGKGGSGKTTLAGSFLAYCENEGKRLLAIDADLNMHLAELLGFLEPSQEKHISHPAAVERIKKYLIGENMRIASPAHFKKTTPPGKGSRLLRIGQSDPILDHFAKRRDNTQFVVVGTYSEEGIGMSCYHNNLGILENMLSHTPAEDAVVVVDMVAGVDAFANSLHSQFDLMVIVVEPTRRSLDVFSQYLALAREAGVADTLIAVGNKVRSDEDRVFISTAIQCEKLLGFFSESSYLEAHDRIGGPLEIEKIETENKDLLALLFAKAESNIADPDARLAMLHALHRRYVSQPFIAERFGDLSGQIDPDFSYRQKFV